MKKTLAVSLLLAILLFTLSSCGGGECTVTYEYGDGRDSVTVGGIMFTSASRPADPVRDGYVFNGWYSDKELTMPYSFTEPLVGSVTLYAGWIPNYEKLSAAVSAYALDACITVTVTHLKQIGHILSPNASSVGSGVIFLNRGGFYYALTNSHVIELEEGCSEREYTVTDSYGREYTAELVCDSPERDLAMIRFSSSDLELKVLEFASEDATVGDTVVAVGSPLGRPNVITFGTLQHIREIEASDSGESSVNVSFPVMWHTAYVNHGSSGGVLLNMELEIIGITFATSQGKDGDFAFGFSIPRQTVIEFVSEALN